MDLDRIDKQILRILFKNGRKSYSKIRNDVLKSDNEKMSHTGIRKRINKLKKNNILKIQGNLNVNALDFVGAIILIEMENYDRTLEMIGFYSQCPRLFHLSEVSGQYNLALGFIGKNMDDLHKFINMCGPTNKKGILHSAIMYINEFIHPSFIPLNMFNEESKEDKCKNICCECSAFIGGKCLGCGNF
jgi:DNA-binding Lrp family transcriptional regulator